MNWILDWKKKAKRQMKALHPEVKRRIEEELNEAAASENPRKDAKRLKGKHAGQWAYRVGDYRARVEFKDAKMIIFVIAVGPRGIIYRIAEDPAEWQPTNPADDGVKD